MSGGPSFFAELKRRNVLRAGLLYVGIVWALSQGAAQLLPVFEVPNWIVRAFVIAGVIGFPFWLVFAWFYEFTPQGLRRESDVATDASIARSTGRKLDFAIIGVLAVAVVLLLTDRFFMKPAVASERSIAVLPFENLSEEKSNGYFAEGIQDEILTRLAKIGALRVISRTSTQQYASKPGNLSEIARQLGVANIVEGSVQKAGDAVRINVQLIRAASDTHLWADIYDRKLENLFTVQSEVADAIATQLKVQLTHEERKELGTPLTTNSQAHDAWLRALVLFNRAGEDPVGVEKSIAQLDVATKADPDFAAAWALMSRAHGSQYFQQFDHSPARKTAAKAALDHAQSLAPASIDTQLSTGYYEYWIAGDYPKALQTFGAVVARDPNNSEAVSAQAYIARRQGRNSDAMRYIDQAVELDPRNAFLLTEASWTHGQGRDYASKLRMVERALDLAPNDPNLIATKAQALFETGHVEDATALLRDVRPDGASQQLVLTVHLLAYLNRDFGDAAAKLTSMLQRIDAAPVSTMPLFQRATYTSITGEMQLRAGDTAAGTQTLRRAEGPLLQLQRDEPGNYLALMELANAQSMLGEYDAAMTTINQAIAGTPRTRDALYGPLLEEWRARIQARHGERDAPIAALNQLLQTNYAAGVTRAKMRRDVDVDWDSLRDDPRFQALLKDPS
jgi:TolB-like protein/Tfp pilus assembly protein PilF